MNKKGQQNPIQAIIGGIFALFFAIIFFGIMLSMSNEISGNVFPGFGFLIVLSFIVIVIGIIASIIRAFGWKI